MLYPMFVAFFFTAYILDFRTDPLENIMTLRDFIMPILCFYIGYSLVEHKKFVINHLNWFFLFFIAYGVLQEICFYSGKLSVILPWDNAHILEMLSLEPSYDASYLKVIRFFGTMDSFVAYQPFCIFICAFLWLNLDEIRNKKILNLNLILTIIFLILSMERSPIVMSLVLLFFWKFRFVVSHVKWLFTVVVIATIVVILVAVNDRILRENSSTSFQYKRLMNVLTLNLKEDAAVKEREELIWSKSLELANKNYFGIGIGRIATSSVKKNPEYVGPHNNFMLYYLGYGVLGLLLFCLMLVIFVLCLVKSKNSQRYFGYGIIASNCAMAMFNLPFFTRPGTLFFLIMGYLIHNCLKTHPKSTIHYRIVTNFLRKCPIHQIQKDTNTLTS